MAFAGVAGAIAAGTLGHIGDRLGHRRVVTVSMLGAAITAAAHAFARSIPSLTVCQLFFGMAISGVLPAVNAMIQQTTDQQHMGKAFGLATSISMIGVALGPLVGGFIAGKYGIRVPFIAAAFCQVIVALALFMTRKGSTVNQIELERIT